MILLKIQFLFISVHIYSYSAFHEMYCFKAALQDMHVSSLQLRVNCYQNCQSNVHMAEMYSFIIIQIMQLMTHSSRNKEHD